MPVVGAEDVLVSVRASSANPWDWHFIRGEPFLLRPGLAGVRKPKFPIPDGDLAGTVGDDIPGRRACHCPCGSHAFSSAAICAAQASMAGQSRKSPAGRAPRTAGTCCTNRSPSPTGGASGS